VPLVSYAEGGKHVNTKYQQDLHASRVNVPNKTITLS